MESVTELYSQNEHPVDRALGLQERANDLRQITQLIKALFLGDHGEHSAGSEYIFPTPAEHLSDREKELDERVLVAAEFLRILDQSVESVTVDPTTGKISFENSQVTIPPDHPYFQKYSELRQKFAPGIESRIQRIRSEATGVLDVANINGVILVTYDSSRANLRFDDVSGTPSSPRGEHIQPGFGSLDLCIIDLNQEKRPDTPPTQTAIHELRHANLAQADFAFASDPHVHMLTGVRCTTDSDLFGEGFDTKPKSGFISELSFKHDAAAYSALLQRPYTDQEFETVELQTRYLDELHSSFLEKKPEWFDANTRVYSHLKKGLHWELVGNHPDDQERTKNILALMQAAYLFDKYLVPEFVKGTQGTTVSEYTSGFISNWNTFFQEMGAIIGTARTVAQCERLLSEKWQAFKTKYSRIFLANQNAFEYYNQHWLERGVVTEHFRKVLS